MLEEASAAVRMFQQVGFGLCAQVMWFVVKQQKNLLKPSQATEDNKRSTDFVHGHDYDSLKYADIEFIKSQSSASQINCSLHVKFFLLPAGS